MNLSEPIQVQIVYDVNYFVASAYNRGMERATSEWVLFIDEDLFICNQHWYRMCVDAINTIGSNTGWITAVTNRIGNPAQRVVGAPTSHDLTEHCAFAKELYEKHGSKVERCKGAMSGFWILTNKTAWRECGGFNEERAKTRVGRKRLLGVDNWYSQALSKAGYRHYRLPGLYVYHMYQQKKLFMRW